MNLVKVKVWKLGYLTMQDFREKNKENTTCVYHGYVFISPNCKYWEEKCWHLLNWSCWTDKRPLYVHANLTHCNSDIILKRDEHPYKYAKSLGFGTAKSLEDAILKMKKDCCNLWPLSEGVEE